MERKAHAINGKGHLEFGGCDTVELAKEFGTPLYVMSEDDIRAHCKEIKASFMDKYENTGALYASKAFSSIAIYKIMKEEGFGIDVVSSGELYTAHKANFPMDKVYFHGNNKSREEIELGIEYGVGHFVIDNFYEMGVIQEEAEKKQKKVNVLLRISPGISGHTHEYISTGQLDSKFGFPVHEDVALKAVKKLEEYPNLEFKGIHCHIGSQIFNKGAYTDTVAIMTQLLFQIKTQLKIEAEQLNLGGGFGVFYSEGDEPRPIHEFIETIMVAVNAKCKEYKLKMPRILIEPGRCMVGEMGITLYTIGSSKEIKGIRKYVSVDGGMADNPRTALYQAEYSAVVANKVGEKPSELVTIAGRCCESGDVLIKDIKIPEVEPGDILAVFSTGAYNYSMSSNYNRLRKPGMIMIKDGKPRIVVKRETYEDLVRNDLE